jgi:DNA-binding transcriptional LysR family regulator
VSRAAEALYLTQPAITARLKSLESGLGVELFVRTGRGMKLSDAGRAFLPYAERTLATVDEGRQLVANLRQGSVGALVIAAAPAVSTYVLPGILRAFRSTYPNVRLGVRTGHTEEVLEMVLRAEAHIGIGRPIRHQDVELIPLFDDEMLLVVAARHPFASRGKVSMAELAEERLILFDRTSSYHELTSNVFRQAGVVPSSTLELDNVEAAKKMVQQGLGVALLPRMALASELKSRSLRPVKLVGAPTLRRPIVALRRKDAGTPIGPVAGFLETLHEQLA